MSHLYSVHVSKELLHRKNLITVIIWEDIFVGFFIIHLLRLLFVMDVVASEAVRIQPRLQLVLFAILLFELWWCRASPPACRLVAFTADTGESFQGTDWFTVTTDYRTALCCWVHLWTFCTSPSCSRSLCHKFKDQGKDDTFSTSNVVYVRYSS